MLFLVFQIFPYMCVPTFGELAGEKRRTSKQWMKMQLENVSLVANAMPSESKGGKVTASGLRGGGMFWEVRSRNISWRTRLGRKCIMSHTFCI